MLAVPGRVKKVAFLLIDQMNAMLNVFTVLEKPIY